MSSTTSTEDVHVGDVGLAIRIHVHEAGVPVNLSSASSVSLKILKPNGVAVTKTASFPNGGTDGWLEYVTVPGDLDRPGTWRAQPVVTGLAGWTGHATTVSFVVRPVIS